MLTRLTRCAKQLWSKLSTAANQFFGRITEPAQSNLVTGTLADLPRSRAELVAENALLRQQLIVLHRKTKTPRLTWRERLSLLFLARWVPNWKQVLQIIKPDTLLRWHPARGPYLPRSLASVLEVQIARAESVESSGSRDNRPDSAHGSGESALGC